MKKINKNNLTGNFKKINSLLKEMSEDNSIWVRGIVEICIYDKRFPKKLKIIKTGLGVKLLKFSECGILIVSKNNSNIIKSIKKTKVSIEKIHRSKASICLENSKKRIEIKFPSMTKIELKENHLSRIFSKDANSR